MRSFDRRARCWLGMALLASAIAGCQYASSYEVRGTIRSSATGAPLGGVRVVLRTPAGRWIDKSGEKELVGPDDEPVVTADDGSFTFRFRADDALAEDWRLLMSREDYQEESCGIPMIAGARSDSGTTRIFVFAYMKPD